MVSSRLSYSYSESLDINFKTNHKSFLLSLINQKYYKDPKLNFITIINELDTVFIN